MNGCYITGCERQATRRALCSAHYTRWYRHGDPLGGGPAKIKGTAEERFWSKVNKNGPIPDYAPELGPCWPWTAGQTNKGYGNFMVEVGKWKSAHVVAYEHFHGLVPHGLQLDHLCRVRLCVNPDHLEPVTSRTNLLRGIGFAPQNAKKTHCPQGHPYDAANTILWRKTQRKCRECSNARKRKGPRVQCKHGHVFSPENTRWYRGYRQCRACDRARRHI